MPPATGEAVSTDANQENTMSESYANASRQRKATIIRRKLSTNFTTLPNEIFDLGLSLEAVGLLAYLIGRSRNWRVIPHQLCEKFGIGRDKMYRLLDELIAAGFVHRSYSALGGCSYTVFDQPTDPLPENQETARDPLPENTEADPLPEKPLPENTDAYQRKTPYQVKTERKEAPNTDSAPSALFEDAPPLHMNGLAKQASGRPKKEASKEASAAFERFWAIYPKQVGKLGAAKAWDKALKEAPADQIIDGVRRYAAERQDQNPQYTKNPSTWLNGGCWMDDPGANCPHEKTYSELADEMRNGGGLEDEATNYDGFADLDLMPDEYTKQAGPVSSTVVLAVGHAVGQSAAAGVSTRTRIVANFDEAQGLRVAILAEGARHEAARAARLRQR
jgi:hypothetical protein